MSIVYGIFSIFTIVFDYTIVKGVIYLHQAIFTLGKRIKLYRVQKGLSQEKLAELSELHPTYIGQLERGEKNPTVMSILKIATALEIPPEKLISDLGIKQVDTAMTIPEEAFCFFAELSDTEGKRLLEILEKIKDFKNNKH